MGSKVKKKALYSRGSFFLSSAELSSYRLLASRTASYPAVRRMTPSKEKSREAVEVIRH